MKTILKTVVGSRLHKLNNEESDFDYRGIFIEPLIEIISPFRKQRANSFIEGKDDDTAYELTHFSKLAASCNPTVLEVLWSNIIIEEDNFISKELKENKIKFLDYNKIYFSHLGYASNQVKKSPLDNPNERTPKAIIAYIRVLRQGIQLLKTGDFNPVYNYPDKDFLLDVKYNFSDKLIPEIAKKMREVRSDLEITFEKKYNFFETDVEWIEDFLLRSYLLGY